MVREMSPEKKVIYYYCTRKLSIRQTVAASKLSNDFVNKTLRKHNLVRSTKAAMKLRSTDDYRTKLSNKQLGENNNSAKLNAEKVIAIRSVYEDLIASFSKSEAQNILAAEYNVARSTISDVVLYRTWKHI